MDTEYIWERLAVMGKAMNHPERLRLINLLAQCERSVEDLSAAANAPVSRVSHNLQQLKAVHLVRSKKQGRRVIYALASNAVAEFWIRYRDFVTAQLPDLSLLLENQPEMIAFENAQRLVDRNEALIVDVRPAEEYQANHLPSAVSIPADSLAKRLDELPRDKTLIICCRGPFCTLAQETLEVLRTNGICVLRLSDDVVGWQVNESRSRLELVPE